MALILASASAIRRSMLEQAGVEFAVKPACLDEASIKAGFRGDDPNLARALAEAKAIAVSGQRNQRDCVIGSDSVVSVEGKRFSKPKSKDDAIEHLRAFRGKEMKLSSAVALARDGKCEWSTAGEARLFVRDLSDRFITEYIDLEWPEVGYCVGVFRLEGRGIQLFDSIEGSYFTILGMPLLPLLNALREHGLLPK